MSDPARPRLVFAACRPPYPLENGARIRTYQLLSGLARSFDTLFVTFEHHADSPDGACSAEQLKGLLGDIEVVTVPGTGPGKRARQAISLLQPQSWTLGRYRTSAFAAALGHAVASHRPNVVHFDDAGVALVPPFADTLNVYCAHNVEQTILRLEARVGAPPRRLFNAVEAYKVAHEERRIWRRVDLCLAVSPLDGAVMKAAGARRVEVCPNGVAAVDRLPLRPLGRDEPLRLLFVGSAGYAPYERGLAWMVREVLPRVRRQVSSVTFDVVGTPAARPVTGEGVRYVGRVPAVEPYYDGAHVVVVPVFEGSGTRLKIIEAAAYGRPVVSTRLGAEGLPLRAGEHFLQADDADGFAAAVVQLYDRWREPAGGGLEPMLTDAREAVGALVWSRVVEGLAALYLSELERRAATKPAAVPAAGSASLPDPSRA